MKLSGGCAEGAGGPLLRVSEWREAGGPPPLFRPRLEKELHSLHAALSLEEFWRATIRVLNAALPKDLIPRYHNPAARDLCALWNRGKAARALSSRAVFEIPPLIQEACRQLKERSSHSLLLDANPGLHPAGSLDHPAIPELRAHLFLTELKCGSGGQPLFLVEFEHRSKRPGSREEGGEPGWSSLSDPGERQMIELLRQGATNAEIAGRLQLSLSKVKRMVSRMFRKLGVSSRAKLMALDRTGVMRSRRRNAVQTA
jgi:DNA-binding CsgD family transcriptional regulator